MKITKWFAVALSMLSIQCYASTVVCAGSYDMDEATKALNNKLVNEKNVSAPTISNYDAYKNICVTVN